MQKGLAILVIYFSCFQMAFGEVVLKAPSRSVANNDFGHELKLEELKEKMQSFADKVNGKDLESDCDSKSAEALEAAVQEENAKATSISEEAIAESEAEIKKEEEQDEWEKFLVTLKQNACGQYIYTWDPEKPAEEVEECKPSRQKGLIETAAEKTIQEEVDEKPLTAFKRNDPVIRDLHKS